jgi:putative phosphoribosyl transferase
VPFANRTEAGRRLADRLRPLKERDPVVLGLPRGGVPVAYEVARELAAPLDVIVVRKLGVPYQPELAMGAIGEEGVLVVDERTLRHTGIGPELVEQAAHREAAEVQRRARRFRGDRARTDVSGRTVVIVDDGIATGSTATAACRVARAHGASYVVLAVPVAPRGWTTDLQGEADELVALETPRHFLAVGQWYEDFSQTSDDEVAELLGRAQVEDDPSDVPPEVLVGPLRLPGRLAVPRDARGVVLFAHGSGSSRHSPRNRYVADRLNRAGFGTLLFDLLLPAEEGNRSAVFDVPTLADRLAEATGWLRGAPAARDLPVGYFGASTGAAAALCAATQPDLGVAAVVSRGGRPDLAGACLDAVTCPTLLVVGGRDPAVEELNRQAQARMTGRAELVVVPGATHLFEEPGALEAVADLAAEWFTRHLA